MTAQPDTLRPPAPQAPDPAPPGWRDRMPAGVLWAIVLPTIVVLLAGGLRYYRLGEPERCYFDETYYYYDARDYLAVGTETSFAVHPPVGKWIIAAGLVAFGVDEGSPVDAAVTTEPDGCIVGEDDPENPAARAREAAESFARRAMSALFGTGAVALTYFIGLRLFRRRSAALLGAALLAVDGLALTMSRISMLDIFLQFFVLLGVLALLVDRDVLWRGTPPWPADDPPVRPPHRDRRWLWVAGLAFGLALATKWSALAPIGLAGLFLLVSEVLWRRRWTGRATPDLARAASRGVLALVMVPITVYLVSYAGWFANVEHTRKADRCPTPPAAATADGAVPGGTGTDVPTVAPPALPDGGTTSDCRGLAALPEVFGGWWEEQGEIFRFHRDLEAEHPYRAPASTWPLMTRPVAYYYEACTAEQAAEGTCEVPEGQVAEILGMGNPAIWWMALVGYPALLWFAVARRRWPAAVIAMFLFGQSVPYLLSPRPVFLFYLTPAVPFIVLSLAYLADRALDSPTFRWVPAALAVLAMAGFAFWAPLFLGLEISRETWDTLIWVRPGWI